MSRDVAISFSTSYHGATVEGTVWLEVKGPVSKKVISGAGLIFCTTAAEKGAPIHPENLTIINVFIAESE